MSTYNINPELNQALEASLAHPDDFMYNLLFAYGLLAYPVIAPVDLFSVSLQDKKGLPVFTDEAAHATFLSRLDPNFASSWSTQLLPEILNMIRENALPVDMIAFNLRTTQDAETRNMAYFGVAELLSFITERLALVGVVDTAENQTLTDKTKKAYYVPHFVGTGRENPDDIKRVFMTVKAIDGKEYIPVFDNLMSLRHWYQDSTAIQSFLDNHGTITAMKLTDIQHPESGVNILDGLSGLAINPFDLEAADFEKALFPWPQEY
ncbi:MAG: hypothetical protein LBI11_07395 [Streptococcaceae bacterium]|jgi:hypothetical protein|nr:hypothetical protein [Streptococcaceae bacterium]